MTLESLDRLREKIRIQIIHPHEYIAMIDEVQVEVDSRYMELPLDADGVPIRCGDTVSGGMGDSGKEV